MEEVRTKDTQGRQALEASEREARDLLRQLRTPLGMPTQTYTETAKVGIGELKQIAPLEEAALAMLQPPAATDRGRVLALAHVADTTNTITLRVAHPDGRINGAVELVLGKRQMAICVATEVNNYVAILGHANGALLDSVASGWPPTTDDPWEVTPPDWQNITAFAGTSPIKRRQHTFTYDASRNVHCLFGGYDAAHMNDWWELDPVTEIWSNPTPGSPPAIRSSHAMVYDPIGHRILIFGGWLGSTRYNDLIACDGSAFTVLIADGAGGSPSKRKDMGIAFDPHRGSAGELIIFGGDPGAGSWGLHETWTCDMNTLTWTNRTSGSGLETGNRNDVSMSYDPVRRLVVMGGGHNGGGTASYDETWEYNNATRLWTQVTPATAPKFPRWAGGTVRWHDMVWCPWYKRMAAIGHENIGDSAAREVLFLHDHDTPLWLEPATTPTWDGVADGNVPYGRYEFRITADPIRHCLYMFGGAKPIGGGKNNQLWRLQL